MQRDGYVLVRARVKRDLEEVVEKFVAAEFRTPIRFHPERDYPYRLSMTREKFEALVSMHASLIDYNNFKNEVGERIASALDLDPVEKRVHERVRKGVYGQVWSDLQDLEDLNDKTETDARHRNSYGG